MPMGLNIYSYTLIDEEVGMKKRRTGGSGVKRTLKKRGGKLASLYNTIPLA